MAKSCTREHATCVSWPSLLKTEPDDANASTLCAACLQVIVNARKPDFFTSSLSLYEIVTEDGLMRPSYSLKRGGVYCGGSGGHEQYPLLCVPGADQAVALLASLSC